MTIPPDIINTLRSLPCFTEVQDIRLLTDGLSHTCFKVTTSSQVFFVKKLNIGTGGSEIITAIAAAEHGISPNVIYHDSQWLVTEFIDGLSLAKAEESSDIKLSVALELMASLHQMSALKDKQSIPTLDTTLSVDHLLAGAKNILSNNHSVLHKVTSYLTSNILSLIFKTKRPMVICHGDVNFTNILLDDGKRTWLIDFECAHRAPIEFDLAMFVAVNDMPVENLNEVVDEYTALVPRTSINLPLLNFYILYSFYINGLWYFANDFRSLATTQWTAFDRLAGKKTLNLPKLTSLIP